jgi:L-fucose mutarotase
MPLKGIPKSISPELLYALARLGHGDTVVISDAHFPADSVSKSTVIGTPIRIHGDTHHILQDILTLIDIESINGFKILLMDKVPADKDVLVPAYDKLRDAAAASNSEILKLERFAFYEKAKTSFVVIHSDDTAIYANCIISRGVTHDQGQGGFLKAPILPAKFPFGK